MDNCLGTILPWIIWEKFIFYDYPGTEELNSKDNTPLSLLSSL